MCVLRIECDSKLLKVLDFILPYASEHFIAESILDVVYFVEKRIGIIDSSQNLEFIFHLFTMRWSIT